MKFDVERSPHDSSHLIYSSGLIGALQTLSRTYVLPGDGFSMDLVGALRLSPLRRGLVADCHTDLVSFFIPHRQIYGDEWIDFIEQGYDETITFPTEDTGSTPIGCLATNNMPAGQTLPKHIPEGYRSIWNNFFRPPTTISERSDLASAWTNTEARYGFACAQMKTLRTALLANNIGASDYEVDTTGDTLSLLDLAQQQAYLRTEQEREFFNTRYRDIISNFGGNTDYRADDRPKMLMRTKFWASGYDVEGTSSTNLGQFAGRVVQSFNHKVPRFYVPEHGVVWTVALNRFLPSHTDENQYLDLQTNPSYDEISGDPAIIANLPPKPYAIRDTFSGSTDATVRGYIPEAQWYRMQPDQIHYDYKFVQGFPFQYNIPNSPQTLILVNPVEFNQMFQTTQLGHFQVQARNNVNIMRRLPTSRDALLT